MDKKEIQAALIKPFDSSLVKWKPEVTKKNQDGRKVDIMRNGQQVAGCTAHIDARDVMNRLDEVVGSFEWSDSYRVLPNEKNVECTLTVMGVSKTDVGQTNEGGFADAMKAAYSDALKRAAVKFGIGRHLYSMEMQWRPFDGYKILDRPLKKQAPPKQVRKPTPAPKPNGDNGPDWDELKGQDKDETGQTSTNGGDWTDYITAVKDHAHFEGQTKHVVSAAKILGITNDNVADDYALNLATTLEYAKLRDSGMTQEKVVQHLKDNPLNAG